MKNISKFRSYLFQPFKSISHKHLLFFGFISIVLASAINYFSSTHFDGILDVHTGRSAPIIVFLLEGLLNSVTVTIIFFVLIRFFILKPVNVSKLFFEQLFARWPLIFISLFSISEIYQRQMHLLSSKYIEMNNSVLFNSTDYAILGFIFFIYLIFSAWFVYLMYRSFSKSSGISGLKGIGIFILGLLIAEMVLKLFYYLIYS